MVLLVHVIFAGFEISNSRQIARTVPGLISAMTRQAYHLAVGRVPPGLMIGTLAPELASMLGQVAFDIAALHAASGKGRFQKDTGEFHAPLSHSSIHLPTQYSLSALRMNKQPLATAIPARVTVSPFVSRLSPPKSAVWSNSNRSPPAFTTLTSPKKLTI